eukprot:scaffold7649_cov68-Cylindrotheca_fusiformis.AAC.1
MAPSPSKDSISESSEASAMVTKNRRLSSSRLVSQGSQSVGKKPSKIIRRIIRPNDGNVVIRMADKKQSSPTEPSSSDGEEEAQSSGEESSNAVPVDHNADNGDSDDDNNNANEIDEDEFEVDNSTKSKSRPTSTNKRHWRVEDHTAYQQRLVAKASRPQKEAKKKAARKRSAALISTAIDTD